MCTLEQSKISEAQSLINNLTPGEYELSQIYGDKWSEINSPTIFGKKFKESVIEGLLSGISHSRVESDNHNRYTISRP
jgi:hypothetical protein